ncbi:MAG: hypothetical protein DSZ05_06025 [Sulfurospirillum sp.]|nr:MAG: hypothetical protein DSZ05_06025 [Sulfurospirillum sp.]
MKYFLIFVSFVLFLHASTDNTTCKRCHPKIFNEYQNSMHKKASIYNDPVHKAVWDKHPLKQKGNYKCAKCHTPADKQLIQNGGLPTPNPQQLRHPVACQTCHTIENIEKHAKSNKNIYSKKPKMFFSADPARRGEKVLFHETKSFFGLFRKTEGSPYHDIDYGNALFYNGNVCMGCHAHKENAKGFAVCDFKVKQDDKSKHNCISCHMQKVKGSYVTLKDTHVHAYHGSNIVTASPAMLEKYVKFSVIQEQEGFSVVVENEANHPLFPHPLRLGVLKVSLQHNGTLTPLKMHYFVRIIGKNGKPSSPWLADSVIKDTTIQAHEKRKILFKHPLEKGDHLIVTLGYHIVNPKMAKKLGITEEHYIRFIPFKKERFAF